MQKQIFSPMAIDALGEMMNISLGSSATAVSNMLDQRVDITTPTVEVVDVTDFTIGNIEPAMGVEIRYVEGLDGSNIMMLKRSDIKTIVDILMGYESDNEEFELNELTISAVCEVMNQMMGAASTAMSDFLGYSVNISTPEPFEMDDLEKVKRERFMADGDTIVVISFTLKIESVLESHFLNVMSVKLASRLLEGLGLASEIYTDGEAPAAAAPAPEPEPAFAAMDSDGGGDRQLSQDEIEKLIQQTAAAAPEPAPAPVEEPSGGSDRKLSQEEIERMIQGMAAAEPEPAPAPAPSSDGGKLSQEEIEKLLAGAASAPAPAPAPAVPQGDAAAQMPQGFPQMGAMPQFPMGVDPSAMQANGGYMGYPMYYPYPYPYPMPEQQQQQPQAQVQPKVINTQSPAIDQLDPTEQLSGEQAQNLELIMEVPLQVTVEIGRTRRKVQDILEFAKGSLVVLDKLAGDQVDLYINGKCIARGDVVVIDDNFGVRITEILQKPTIENTLNL